MIRALALVVDEHKIIKPLNNIKDINITYKVIDDNFNLSEPFPDIILTVSDWRADIARILIEAKNLKIPTLLFQDGTLDWIIQNKGDLYGGGGGATHFHPIFTDKIAVIGHQSARLISSWNSPKKVELVGFPILQKQIDESEVKKSQKIKTLNKNKINVLITSTRQAGFCEEHKKSMISAFKDLKIYFENNTKFSVIWRLSGDISKRVKVQNSLQNKVSSELIQLIKLSDIVISSQSTVVIEAMLQKKPVAIIDYLNSPQYYPTAWFINSKSNIDSVVNNMIKKEINKLEFQNYILQDVLYLVSDSIERARLLIQKMVEHRKKTGDINFPENMLRFNRPFHSIKSGFEIKEIFPKVAENYEYSKDQLVMLISRYKNENRLLRKKLQSNSIFGFLKYIIKRIRKK